MSPRLKYLLTSACKGLSKACPRCPSCGSGDSEVITRKYVVTSLRRCGRCALLYRAPVTTPVENEAFYQHEYEQGVTSDTPNPAELQRLLTNKFEGSELNYGVYIKVLQALGVAKGARILDFGCSWGYGTWQLEAAGFDMDAFEISRPRCAYARENLKVCAVDSLIAVPRRDYDVFFSAHVLEHVPSVQEVVAYARTVVRPGGLFVAFTPNGSDALRQKHPHVWQHLWGLVHPNFLDAVFYRRTFPVARLWTAPYKYEELRDQAGQGRPLDGYELLAVATL